MAKWSIALQNGIQLVALLEPYAIEKDSHEEFRNPSVH
jgi:hypothetical protein